MKTGTLLIGVGIAGALLLMLSGSGEAAPVPTDPSKPKPSPKPKPKPKPKPSPRPVGISVVPGQAFFVTLESSQELASQLGETSPVAPVRLRATSVSPMDDGRTFIRAIVADIVQMLNHTGAPVSVTSDEILSLSP